jgi:hypothetical protein
VNIGHRRVHRLVWPLLVPLLGAAVTLAVAVRAEPPPMKELPGSLAMMAAPEGEPLWRSQDSGLSWALYPQLVEVTVLEPMRRPDPSVWWASEAPQGGQLPQGAVLLGLLPESGVQRLLLPQSSGHLVVFSLADGEVLATVALGGR